MSSSNKVFTRTLKRGLAVDIVFLIVLYCTSHTDVQFMADTLITVLSLMIVVLLAVYAKMGAAHESNMAWIRKSKASIHYPLRAAFEAKANAPSERREYRKYRGVDEYV
jgi:hypothetical protein